MQEVLIFIIAVFGVSLLTSICLIIYGIVKVQSCLVKYLSLLALCFFPSAFSCIPLWGSKRELSRTDNASCENASLVENKLSG